MRLTSEYRDEASLVSSKGRLKVFDNAFDAVEYTPNGDIRPVEVRLRKTQGIITDYWTTTLYQVASTYNGLELHLVEEIRHAVTA